MNPMTSGLFLVSVLLPLWVFAAPDLHSGEAAPANDDPKDIFTRRILPIFKSPNPSSCTQCHLAGVELKNYIRPSAAETFASLRDQGLVDLDKPESSRILALIAMGEENKDPSLISDKVRAGEYAAFRDWLVASCSDAAMRDTAKLPAAKLATPPRTVEIIRHARKDKVLASFEEKVWAMRFRCMSCHAPDGSESARLVKEEGDEDFLWIRPGGPEATMRYLIANELVDLKQPDKSLLLRKATAQVKHGGGKKMEVGDLGYKQFRSWIEDYARTVNDAYRKNGDLPPEDPLEYVASEVWLKISNTPGPWGEKLLQVSVHAFDQQANAWQKSPIALCDRPVDGNGNYWQHWLILVGERDSDRLKALQDQPRLPAGRYLVRVFVDSTKRLEKDWRARMDMREYVGETVIDTEWPNGYGSMTVIDAATIKPPAPAPKR